MTYREQLNKVAELGLNICDLEIANEFDGILDFDYTEEQFEKLCKFGVKIYLAVSEMTASAIADCINDLVNEDGKTVEEIIQMKEYDFIDKASNWL